MTNLPATSVQGNSATLNGWVLSTGGFVPPNVVLYYGRTDGGTNVGAWSNSVALGFEGGSYSYAVTGLSNNTTYYYAALATNAAGIAWAMPSQSFTTLPFVPALVTNLPPSNVQGNSAYLNGRVVSIRSQTPTVTMYYGTYNGGTNVAAWDIA